MFLYHYWLTVISIMVGVSIVHAMLTLTIPPLWAGVGSIVLVTLWWKIYDTNRIIPLHKDWRDFGKSKNPFSIEDDIDEEDEMEEEWIDEDEEEELSDAQSEFNSSIAESLDHISSGLYDDEIMALSYESEINDDESITVIIKYKQL
jgi:hypothetical protein